jgi:hypothetical protein
MAIRLRILAKHRSKCDHPHEEYPPSTCAILTLEYLSNINDNNITTCGQKTECVGINHIVVQSPIVDQSYKNLPTAIRNNTVPRILHQRSSTNIFLLNPLSAQTAEPLHVLHTHRPPAPRMRKAWPVCTLNFGVNFAQAVFARERHGF